MPHDPMIIMTVEVPVQQKIVDMFITNSMVDQHLFALADENPKVFRQVTKYKNPQALLRALREDVSLRSMISKQISTVLARYTNGIAEWYVPDIPALKKFSDEIYQELDDLEAKRTAQERVQDRLQEAASMLKAHGWSVSPAPR